MSLVLLEVASFGLIVSSHFVLCRPRDLRPVLLRYFTDPKEAAYWAVYDYHPRYGHANALRNTAECGYTTDRYGFIHNGDPARDLRRARFRIFVMGGSTVAGSGASCNQFTLPALLERRIRDAGFSDVAVVNAGVAGYYSAQELPFVVDEVLRYDPYIVISLTGVNDAYVSISGDVSDDPSAPLHQAAYYLSPYLRDLAEQRRAMESPLGASAQALRNLGAIARRTYAAYMFKTLRTVVMRPELRARRVIDDPLVGNVVAAYGSYVPKEALDALLSAPHPEEIVERQPSPTSPPPAERAAQLAGLARAYARYMTAERAALEAQGMPFLCVFQPQLALEHDRLTESEAIAYRVAELAMRNRFGIDFVRDLHWFLRSADEQFRRHGLVCSDATAVFAEETGTYSDPMHANDKGNGLLAEFIFQDLVKRRFLPPRAPGRD